MSLKVEDKYRTNRLSVEPGGYEVTIIYEGSETFIYDKIKSPGSYIKGISNVSQGKPIIKILIDGEEVWNLRHDETEPWNTPAIKNIKKKI